MRPQKQTRPSSRVRRTHRARVDVPEAPIYRVTVEYADDADPMRRLRLTHLLQELIQIHCRR